MKKMLDKVDMQWFACFENMTKYCDIRAGQVDCPLSLVDTMFPFWGINFVNLEKV